ncbi:MAG: transcriptional repressor LexA [Candidatus Eremiobacteraeota bacterium]|nr:transcriptional repressor LexA [Candidatus Eremiobacteraeota bacterium]
MDSKVTGRQQAILDVIKSFTREHGYPPSVREIGERVGLSSSSTVQCHLRTLEKKGMIRRDPTKPRALVSGSDAVFNVIALPIVGRVAAGVPITAVENIEDELALPAHFVTQSGSFILRIKGDSMIDAAILDGDLIVVSPQKIAANGEIVVALIDDEATVKTFYKEDNRVRLQPENKFMAPIFTDKVDIIGKVSAVIRRL